MIQGDLAGDGRQVVGRWAPLPFAHTVVTAEVYKKDVIFKVNADRRLPPTKERKPRGSIKGFSAASQKRLRLLVRNTNDMWTGFVTLTYPEGYPTDGAICKRHLHAFCAWLRRMNVTYIWRLEFQKRGAPHYHFLVSGWIPRDRYVDQNGEPCKATHTGAVLAEEGLESRWFQIVSSGNAAHLRSGTQVKAVKNPDEVGIYMSKYLTKIDQAEVPEGYIRVGRFWGASKCLTKVIYKMRGLYQDVAAEKLKRFVGLNNSIRQGWAERMQKESELETDPNKRANKEARAMGYASQWEWKGYGFMVIGGADAFRSILRQAVLIDQGGDPKKEWQEWDGKPEAKKVYCSPAEQIARLGQLTLDGGLEQSFPDKVVD